MLAHKSNWCGGSFQDWLELYITSKCNGHCSWCIDKRGYHPKTEVDWKTLLAIIKQKNITNIAVLGGEPTLYDNLDSLLVGLREYGFRTHLTTNGWNAHKILHTLSYLSCLNISVHHYRLDDNWRATGIRLLEKNIASVVKHLSEVGVSVRLNCNLIRGYIDSSVKIHEFLEWSKSLGITNVRFSELLRNTHDFVDASFVLPEVEGLNDEPFSKGCTFSKVIDEVGVSIKQVCGLVSSKRKDIPGAEIPYKKQILFYDGHIYSKWITQKEGEFMRSLKTARTQLMTASKESTVDDLLNDVADDSLVTGAQVKQLISKAVKLAISDENCHSSGCGTGPCG